MESERVELHKSLVDDIIKGMEQVEQLEVSSPSRQRMLASYQEALFLLTGRRGQCHRVISSSSHSDPPSAGFSSLKRKYREDESVKITTPAEVIWDNGYKWRKYGAKKVLGSEFPRSYYKCIFRGCPARKHLQRSSIDATICEVTYTGKHNHRACAAGGGASAQTGEATGQVRTKEDVVAGAGHHSEWESRETISVESVEYEEF